MLSGVTPLGVACERGHTGVVRALLDAKASPEIATREGFRPIHIATQFGKNDVLQLLVQRGKAECNVALPAQDTFPLLLATNFTCALHEDADQRRRLGHMKSLNTAVLHYAFSAEAVATLVAAKADDESIASRADTAHEACKTGAPEVVLALLTMGADPEARTSTTCLAWSWRCRRRAPNRTSARMWCWALNMIKEISRRYGVLYGRHSAASRRSTW